MEAIVNGKKAKQIAFEPDRRTGQLDGKEFSLDIAEETAHRYHILRDNSSYRVDVLAVDREAKKYTIRVNGNDYEVELKSEMDNLLKDLGISTAPKAQKKVMAPMPGLVLDIAVKPGDTVAEGDKLLVLEAMKMENVLKSAQAGTIKSIHVSQNEAVEKKQVLLEFE